LIVQILPGLPPPPPESSQIFTGEKVDGTHQEIGTHRIQFISGGSSGICNNGKCVRSVTSENSIFETSNYSIRIYRSSEPIFHAQMISLHELTRGGEHHTQRNEVIRRDRLPSVQRQTCPPGHLPHTLEPQRVRHHFIQHRCQHLSATNGSDIGSVSDFDREQVLGCLSPG